MTDKIKTLNGIVPIEKLVHGEVVDLLIKKNIFRRVYEGTENKRPDLGEGIARFLYRLSFLHEHVLVDYFHIEKHKSIRYIDLDGGHGTLIIHEPRSEDLTGRAIYSERMAMIRRAGL